MLEAIIISLPIDLAVLEVEDAAEVCLKLLAGLEWICISADLGVQITSVMNESPVS